LIADEISLVRAWFGLRELGDGVMIDVGACHGSALLPFARAGWRVLAVEPDEVNRQRLLANCATWPRDTVIPDAVCDHAGLEMPLYRSPKSPGISALRPFDRSHQLAGHVATTTVAAIVQAHGVDHIDFLKVDTEGFDLFVLR
jgi:FkbM family methyltransferase